MVIEGYLDTHAQERAALLAGATPPQAGKRPQPFVMHKMAFHRGRALGIIRRTLHSSLPSNAEVQAGEPMSCNESKRKCMQNRYRWHWQPPCLVSGTKNGIWV